MRPIGGRVQQRRRREGEILRLLQIAGQFVVQVRLRLRDDSTTTRPTPCCK
jgi:hypothetical protein